MYEPSVPSYASLRLDTIIQEKRWYRVPYLEFDDLIFFDRHNPDGTITLRNMPKYKKNKEAQRRRVAREMKHLERVLQWAHLS